MRRASAGIASYDTRAVAGPRLLLIALSAALLTAGSLPADPGPRPAANPPDMTKPRVVAAADWIKVLPAPATPLEYQPPAGPRMAWPLRGELTQPYGCTGFELERPAADCPGGFHSGIDIGGNAPGTPIRAAEPGLAYAFQDDERYGNHVIVQHLSGLSTLYAHMTRTNVAWGQSVNTGDVIGFVGSTGNSTGPHLHFEVRFAGSPLDPMPYLNGSPADPYPLPSGWPGAPKDDWIGRR